MGHTRPPGLLLDVKSVSYETISSILRMNEHTSVCASLQLLTQGAEAMARNSAGSTANTPRVGKAGGEFSALTGMWIQGHWGIWGGNRWALFKRLQTLPVAQLST